MLRNKISLKRILDLIFSLIIVFFTLLPMLMIGLAVKLSSNGSIIHWSERVGLNNKTFIMPKFRTMFTDTPQVATHLLNLNESRITKVGFLLRKYSLDELLAHKVTIAEAVFADVLAVTEDLGVSLLSCGIKDVILTGEMKEIMNQVLIAEKKAQASVITRREETAATRSLLNSAKLMEENKMLYKLKEMEYVEKIADKIGEITVNGNGGMVKQLKEIFTVDT